MENQNSVERGIHFADLWKVFKRCVVIMLCSAILCGAAAGLYTEYTMANSISESVLLFE